jgi:membrane associated rhomboid family serine protease
MDWSLALLSQGIEPVIEHVPEAGAWGLRVPLAEHARALAIIQQYRTENRGWPWRRELALPDVVFDAGSLIWVLLIGVFFALGETDAAFKSAGVMDVAAVSRGQWWRLLTAVFLHADMAHLATNAAVGFVLLALALGRYGTGIGALAALLAGAFGNAVVWLLCAPPRTGLGASGMVLGALGLLAAQWVALREVPARVWLAGLGAAVLLFLLLGSSPGTDLLAHAGGFVGGVLLGIVPAHYPKLARNGPANLLAGLLFAALTLVAWWLALRHTG